MFPTIVQGHAKLLRATRLQGTLRGALCKYRELADPLVQEEQLSERCPYPALLLPMLPLQLACA